MLNVLSLGAGVQSSTIALMAAHGEITPMPDCAIFADTQSEPSAVYRYLDWLEMQLPFPVHRVTAGSLRENILLSVRNKQHINARPPFFVSSGGMLRRQCTQDYKLIPIHRKLRGLIGLRPRQRGPKDVQVISWIGISIDEATRMKPSRYPWIHHRWPLIEMEVSRRQCEAWLRRHEYPVPSKSACTFCPYHDAATWRNLQQHDPGAFADAVAVDEAIRQHNGRSRSTASWYVHRSLQPLDQVDFAAVKGNKRQINLFENECEGMCGV